MRSLAPSVRQRLCVCVRACVWVCVFGRKSKRVRLHTGQIPSFPLMGAPAQPSRFARCTPRAPTAREANHRESRVARPEHPLRERLAAPPPCREHHCIDAPSADHARAVKAREAHCAQDMSRTPWPLKTTIRAATVPCCRRAVSTVPHIRRRQPPMTHRTKRTWRRDNGIRERTPHHVNRRDARESAESFADIVRAHRRIHICDSVRATSCRPGRWAWNEDAENSAAAAGACEGQRRMTQSRRTGGE